MTEIGIKQSKNPNEHLAQVIVEALAQEGLLTLKRTSDALKKIQTGKASPTDWRNWAEEILPKEEAGNVAAQGD